MLSLLQYSFSLTTFSPSGKLVQIEYALNAVAGGSTSLGIKAQNGVVIATEKKLRSTLVDETTVQKISLLTPNIGVAYSGMGPDSRVLVRKARKSAQVPTASMVSKTLKFVAQTQCALTEDLILLQTYYRTYKEHIPVAQLCREVAAVMQEFTREPSHTQGPEHARIENGTQFGCCDSDCVLLIQSRVVCGHLESRCSWPGLMTTAHSCTRSTPRGPTLHGRPVPSARTW